MNIVVASKLHLDIVQNLARKIWPVAYHSIISEEQIEYMLNKIYDLDSLEQQWEAKQIFLLAEENNNFVGYASYELNCSNSNKTKLHKLYLCPQMQGKGIGKKLINYIIEKSLMANNEAIYLNVNKFNPAKDFYLKYGFKIAFEEVLEIGNDFVMDDFVMEINLQDFVKY